MKGFKKTDFLGRLGRWVLKLRKLRGFGQDELTREAGLSKGTVSKIENGVVDPRATTLVKLAHALEVPPPQILELEKYGSA